MYSVDNQSNKLSHFYQVIVNIGKEIEKRAKELKISAYTLADMINTSPQNVYGIFKRESIDTGLLMSISEALNYDFFSLYRMKKEIKDYEQLRDQLARVEEEKEVYFNTVQNNLDYIKSLKNNLEKLQEAKADELNKEQRPQKRS